MIHRLILLDRKKSIGKTLFDDGTIDLQQDLLIGLIQALMSLGETLGPSKGQLREAELGRLQLSILTRDRYAYAVIQDTVDNENFTKQLLDGIILEFHDAFLRQNITRNFENEDELKVRIKELLTSMEFPTEIIPDVKELVKKFNEKTNNMVDTLFLSDLDNGVVEVFQGENDNIIKVLSEILSEIDFRRQWIGQSKLVNPIEGEESLSHEVWVIHRIGLSDFIILGRAFYNPDLKRDILVDAIEGLSDSILVMLEEHDIL